MRMCVLEIHVCMSSLFSKCTTAPTVHAHDIQYIQLPKTLVLVSTCMRGVAIRPVRSGAPLEKRMTGPGSHTNRMWQLAKSYASSEDTSCASIQSNLGARSRASLSRVRTTRRCGSTTADQGEASGGCHSLPAITAYGCTKHVRGACLWQVY